MIKALDSDISWGNMLQVGEVARKLGLNPQTLYFYERIGLIPSPKRTEAGYRLFDDQDIERLSFISRAKGLGLSRDEIKEPLLQLQEGHLTGLLDYLKDDCDCQLWQMAYQVTV